MLAVVLPALVLVALVPLAVAAGICWLGLILVPPELFVATLPLEPAVLTLFVTVPLVAAVRSLGLILVLVCPGAITLCPCP